MIGDGWDGEPTIRPGPLDEREATGRSRIAIVTGSRSEFGLLKPVMSAVAAHAKLELAVIVAGEHLISPAITFREVKKHFQIAATVPMQIAGRTGRAEDVESVARGVARFGRAFTELHPAWIVVLGDRIEAFAAASAASIGGFALAHIHGGDRAEGVADEAMRHAISKLAHLHLPATPTSAERLTRMGERREHIHIVGSPAIDELAAFEPLSDDLFAELASPDTLFLMHPIGRTNEAEEAAAAEVLKALANRRVLALDPNHDPGREGIRSAIASSGVTRREHLPRAQFVGLLKRLAASNGLMVGNSSAGLIEAAALRLATVNVGSRQGGRESPPSVIHSSEYANDVTAALRKALALERASLTHPYGNGTAGAKIADLLAMTDPRSPGLLRKRCTF